jgi:hypothetical protein
MKISSSWAMCLMATRRGSEGYRVSWGSTSALGRQEWLALLGGV